MLNYIWLGLVILAVVLGGINGKIEAVTKAAVDSAGTAVTLAIGLIGVMTLWLGIMRIAEESGLLKVVARVVSPVMRSAISGRASRPPRNQQHGSGARPWCQEVS